jgi:Pyruvate/2-oxoacid:ferredoxin oxidoreductase delta subunit
MKRATRDFFKMHGWRNVHEFIHGYFYFKYYDLYVIVLLNVCRRLVRFSPRLARLLGAFIMDRYHFKTLTPDMLERIVKVDQDVSINPEDAKKVIPYPHATAIILSQDMDIAVMDCPCRTAEHATECELNKCMAMGQPIVDFWLEHCSEKYHARKISQDEALDLMAELRKTGHVQTAWFKDACGQRMYAICNCCKKCCGAFESFKLSRALNIPNPPFMGVPSGYVSRIDAEACKSCGKCIDICSFEAIEAGVDGKSYVIYSACMGCGLCRETCPNDAVELLRDEKKGVPFVDILETA